MEVSVITTAERHALIWAAFATPQTVQSVATNTGIPYNTIYSWLQRNPMLVIKVVSFRGRANGGASGAVYRQRLVGEAPKPEPQLPATKAACLDALEAELRATGGWVSGPDIGHVMSEKLGYRGRVTMGQFDLRRLVELGRVERRVNSDREGIRGYPSYDYRATS